jgi:hypothetical protein
VPEISTVTALLCSNALQLAISIARQEIPLGFLKTNGMKPRFDIGCTRNIEIIDRSNAGLVEERRSFCCASDSGVQPENLREFSIADFNHDGSPGILYVGPIRPCTSS